MTKVVNMRSGVAVPQLFITKGKQRLKQYVDTVYLNDGDEFELELFNPTQNKLLTKIELNGNSLGNGIVLRPGERVFLERYLDDPKKFKFETYNVDGTNTDVINAIQSNGDVVVKFFEETKWTLSNSSLNWTDGGSGITYTSGINTLTSGFVYTPTSAMINCSYTSNTSLETGRVEKGSTSNQSFTYDYSNFNSHSSWSFWFKIKPQSTKLKTSEDLVVYCTGCGAKRKKDRFKFCPHCGTKY